MFYTLDEYPCLGSKGLSPYPDEWDDQQDMSPTRVRFTPATGALSGVDTWFEYYRGLNDLISAGGRAQIGVRTAAVATFNGYNFDPQRAANPVIAYDAVASLPVLGGLYNDFRAVVYNSKIRLFIAIYGNPSGSNRTAIFESTDGFTFTYVGEAQKDATYLGRTIGALANVSGTLVSLVSIADGAGGGNGRQKWISTDGGLTWLDRGLAIHVGDAGDWNGLNYVGGTMQLEGDYYVALLPGMPFIGNNGSGNPYLDWPEAVGAFRIPAASILTADVLWEANSSNPLIIAGPTHNALWHMALFEDRGTTYSTVETWGVPGFENIGTATTRALRTTPYYGTESRVSSSQLYELKMASRHWLDRWTTPVVADGTYTLRHVQSGKFVSVVDGQPVLTEAGTIAEFSVERELSFYTISNADLCLSAIDDLMQTGMEFIANPGAVNNAKGQWWIMPWEDRPADQPQLVVLTNRYSRLAASLPRDTETEGAPLVQAPFLGHASMIFELAPVVHAETTTEFPDPENPLLNIELPAGNLVGTTEPQNLANKTLELAGHTGTIAQLITAAAAGQFAAMEPGGLVFAGQWPFVKKAGAAYAGMPVGFVPAVAPHPKMFGARCTGVVRVVGGEAVLYAGHDDTTAWENLWAYCNATKIAPDLNDVGVVCVQHDADIVFNADFDLKGAEIRLIGGMYGDGTFSHATIKTAFRAYDADCPIVTGTVAVSDLNMVEGSVTPTADFFTEPGYVEIYANATNGPFVANRARTALDQFRQPFALNKDGIVTKPLARSMVGTGQVTYSYRKMPAGGKITVGNFVVDAELFNNQTIFRLSRNNVNVINGTVRGENLPALSQNQLFTVDYAAYITYHDIVAKAMGDPDESKSSYVFHASHGAEITYTNCIALGEPWGASGQNNVSGIRWLNCTMNRLDVHQAGFNIEVVGGYVIGIGVGYGYGGGLLQLTGVTLINSKVYHRSDWAGDWWGTIRLDSCTWINKSYEAIGLDAGDYSPMGSNLIAAQAPNVIITNMTRGDREETASQISPYKIGLRAGSMPLIAPRQLLVDGVSSSCEYRLGGGACMEDMILPAGISRRTEVSFSNIQGCTGYTLNSDWTFKVPATSAVGPAIGAAGTITFSAQPEVNSTVTINGTVFTFVASGAVGAQCNIGANLTATLTALAAVLNASAVAGVATATYGSNATQLTVGYDMLGVAGNAFTLAASVSPASNGTVSAATLASGAGHQYNLRISNSNEVAVDVTNSPGVRAYYSDIRLVANYMAINCITQMSDITFGAPLLKPGFTAAPVCGALTSGTFNFGSVIGGRVEAGTSAWDFSNPRFISGVVISASNASCVYPFGVSREDMFRGWTPEMVGQTVMIRQSADRTMAASTAEQAIFDEGGFSKVALAVGIYRFKLLYRVENMDATLASNLRFNPKGDGSATLAHILYDSAGRDATNLLTSASNLTGIMVATEASLPLLNGVASANAGGTLSGYFEVTAAGTIRPSFKLDVGVAATVKADTFFECTKIASASVAGPWSA